MEEKIFTPSQCQKIVDTILIGYNHYLNERIEKHNTMEVSNGYAWTKANHIDDAFAKAYQKGELDFVTKFDLGKAGESWGYLEFHGQSELGKSLVIIKNMTRLHQTFEESSKRKPSQYLLDYAQISKRFVKEHIGDSEDFAEQVVLDVFPPQDDEKISVTDLEKMFDEFFVIVYEADSQGHLGSVQVVVLNPENQRIVPVQNLSMYLSSSDIVPVEAPEIFDLREVVPNIEGDYGFVTKSVPKEKE